MVRARAVGVYKPPPPSAPLSFPPQETLGQPKIHTVSQQTCPWGYRLLDSLLVGLARRPKMTATFGSFGRGGLLLIFHGLSTPVRHVRLFLCRRQPVKLFGSVIS